MHTSTMFCNESSANILNQRANQTFALEPNLNLQALLTHQIAFIFDNKLNEFFWIQWMQTFAQRKAQNIGFMAKAKTLPGLQTI